MAHGLASIPPELAPAARQELIQLLLALLVHQAQGSSYLPLGDAERPGASAEFGADPASWPALLREPALRCLLEGPEAPLRLEPGRLYTGRIQVPEARLAAAARARSGACAELAVDPGVLEAPDALVPEQCAAVAAAVSGRLTLVTGGPGTGKTAIVVAMLRALVRLDPPLRPDQIVLAAPTGKAAQRMGQAIRQSLRKLSGQGRLEPRDEALGQLEPGTLHRLLGWDPGSAGFRQHAGNPLAARAVIVDEASMIGLELMDALFAAVPGEAALVLLGDADQLPSVEAGRAFRDLGEALPERLRRLQHSFRMAESDPLGRQILSAARAVNAGDVAGFWRADPPVPLRAHGAELTGSGMEVLLPGGDNLADFCRSWAERCLWTVDAPGGAETLGSLAFTPLVQRAGPEPFAPAELARVRRVLEHYDQARILCPLNAGPELRSVESLNAYFHDRAVAAAMAQGGLEQSVARVAGEPVMVRHNDYRRGLFNGDQGVVMLVVKEADGMGRLGRPVPWGVRVPRHPMAPAPSDGEHRERSEQAVPPFTTEVRREVFFPRGDGFLHFPLAAIQEELELCYAMTVHKAQGSEYRRIALILPDQAGPLLTREILYTALTRARQAVTIVGTRAVLEEAIQKPVRRWSGLAERILGRGLD